nr:ice-binding family protein [uncultured Duganella sp.]
MNVLQRYTKTLFCSIGFLATALLAGCGGGDQGRDPLLGVPAATLVSLAVTPAAPAIALGATQHFTANATYSDGTVQAVTAAWTSATPAVATVAAATGLATGTGAGSAVIGAAYGGKTASATLTVTPAALLSIAVTPQAPTVQIAATRQLAVIGTYSDATTQNLTAGATFVSATPASATVDSAGLVTGAALGTSVITATSNGKSATTTVTVPAATLTGIAVTPATATVLTGGQQQFVATATYSDNTTAFVTGSAVWSSSSPSIGTVAASGIATGVAAGATSVTATVGAQSGSAALTVTAVALPPPAVLAVPLGGAANFAVLAGTSLTNNAGGTTLITGDVGAPSQTVDPTQAAGYTNYKSGAILAGALADLQTAIGNANGRTCDVSFAGDIDLGGLTLAPGVYCYAGAISITGTVTLNGPGVYIFRTALTLNSTANSIVALGNGATAANVNWLPVGPTTLGANSVFKGTILGQSAAITVGDNTTLLNGRVLTGAAVTLRNNQIAK